jgi:hypothetical protein
LFYLKVNVGVRENEKQAEISLTSAVKFLWIAFAGTGSGRLRRVMIATPAIFGRPLPFSAAYG